VHIDPISNCGGCWFFIPCLTDLFLIGKERLLVSMRTVDAAGLSVYQGPRDPSNFLVSLVREYHVIQVSMQRSLHQITLATIASMRNFSLLGATALLAASAIAVEEGHNMDMPCFNDICFTSWRCWYPRVSKYDNTIDARCNVPHHVYTPANDGTRWNTMVWDSSYYVTWKSSYETQGEDIVLEWLMFETPGLPRKPYSS
jgi:hypothetical protein